MTDDNRHRARRNDETTVAGQHRRMRQADREVIQGRMLCNWGEAFKSIVGTGTASILTDMDERRKALRLLMAQQAHITDAAFTDNQVLSVIAWKIESDHLTAKVRPKPEPPHSRI